MKALPPSPLVALVFLCSLALSTGLAQAQANVEWDFEFDGTAEASGYVNASVTIEFPNRTSQGLLIAQVRIEKGTSPEDKCQAIVNDIRRRTGNRFDITFNPPDDDFQIKIANPGAANGARIISGSIGSLAGEDNEAVKDDPAPDTEPLILTAYFHFLGTGKDLEGRATFQVGDDNPRIVIPTQGKTAETIQQELIRRFNSSYEPLGFVAVPIPDLAGLMVANVPCPLGVRAGSSDTGLVYEMGLGEPPTSTTCQSPEGANVTAGSGLCAALTAEREQREADRRARMTRIVVIVLVVLAGLIAVVRLLRRRSA